MGNGKSLMRSKSKGPFQKKRKSLSVLKHLRDREVDSPSFTLLMAHSLKAVAGGDQNKAVAVKRALLSVSDKVGDACTCYHSAVSWGYF